jgi:GH24 family phage-related lysozyme (muramidase)
MNFDLIDKTILQHEGERLKVYADTLGNPTVGIGHLIRPEDKLQIGDTISQDQSKEFFIKDRNTAVKDSLSIFPDLATFPGTVQAAVVSMLFNLGKPKFSTWTNTINLIKSHDWKKVSDYLNSSAFDKWRSQVGKRVSELAGLFQKGAAGTVIIAAIGLSGIAFILYQIFRNQNNA